MTDYELLYLPSGIGVIQRNGEIRIKEIVDPESTLHITSDNLVGFSNLVLEGITIDHEMVNHLIESGPFFYFYDGNKNGQTDNVCPYAGLVEINRDALLEIRGFVKYIKEPPFLKNLN